MNSYAEGTEAGTESKYQQQRIEEVSRSHMFQIFVEDRRRVAGEGVAR